MANKFASHPGPEVEIKFHLDEKNSFELLVFSSPWSDGEVELDDVDEDVDDVDDEEHQRGQPEAVVIHQDSGHCRPDKVPQEEAWWPHA